MGSRVTGWAVTLGVTRWSVEVGGSKSEATGPTDSESSVEGLCVLPRVTGAVGLGVGCFLEVKGWSSGVVGTLASGVLTDDLRVLP